MKKTLKLLAAGTAAAWGMTAHGQSSDALIDKLVDKGILTVKEANDLREEADQDFTTAFQTKTGMPDWVKNYKLSGDFRGRYDGMFANEMAPVLYNPNLAVAGNPNGAQNFYNHNRTRYRLRLGLTVNMQDDMEVGLRLGSGDPSGPDAGTPLSNNSTFSGNGSKKSIWVDAAYGRWTPVHSGHWNLMLTIGKMDQPFQTTWMIFDPDYTPEGASAQVTYQLNDKHSFKFITGAFVLDYASTNGSAPYFTGNQIVWDAAWAPKVESSLGVALFAIGNKSDLSAINTDIAYINAGNSRNLVSTAAPNNSSGNLLYDYTPIVVDASLTYKLDSFPFYQGVFPITARGELMHNPGAPSQNEGWWVGMTLGKAGVKHAWDLSYRYEFLEADAWYDQLVDDDNVAFYPATAPQTANYPYNYSDNDINGTSNVKGGMAGGTNIKGHLIKFDYSLTDALTFSLTAYLNSLIVPPTHFVNNVSYSSAAVHVMGDLQWKF